MEWFRWYHGTTEDTKFRLVARNAVTPLRNVIAVWAMVLESASQGSGEGKLKFGSDYIAVNLDFSDDEIARIWTALERGGLIRTDMGDTYVTNWGKRQYLTDRRDATNAERQRRWREKQKGNGVTPFVTALRNGPVTHQTTDTDTDTDIKKEPPKAPRKRGTVSPEFELFWSAWPNKVGKPAALRAFPSALTRAPLTAILDGLEAYKRTKPPDRPWLNPSTFLNQDRWADVPAPTVVKINGNQHCPIPVYGFSKPESPKGPPPKVSPERLRELGLDPKSYQ